MKLLRGFRKRLAASGAAVKTMWHVETDYFALIIFVIMLARSRNFQTERTQQDPMFKIVLWVSIFSALIDLISSEAMNQASDWWFYQISLTIYYVTMPLLAAVWMSYAITVISTDEWKVTQKAIAISLIPYFVYALIAGSNPCTGLFFGLSSTMEYTRGPLFWPIAVGFTTFYPAAGTDAHIAKPIQVQQLYETLAGFIGAKSQEEPHRMKEEPR